jgi:hypothetical protein
LTGLFFAYFEFIARHLPHGTSVVPVLGLIILPVVLGGFAYLGLRSVRWRIAWLIALPILVPLPTLLLLGGDPAKPGLENVIYVGIVLVMVIAEAASWLIDRLVVKRGQVNVEA